MLSLGVDVGGTHTDLVSFDKKTGKVIFNKIATTVQDPSIGTMDALEEILKLNSVRGDEIKHFMHGTTVATNIALEHKGAKVGLITTKGFRDILHIARHKRPKTFSLQLDLPWQKYPLVPRRRRLTVSERTVPPGDILVAISEDEVRQVVRTLISDGVEAIAVCFLHAFLNPFNELLVKKIIHEEAANMFVSLSHEIISHYREYERFSTTAVNCYVGPKTVHYLKNLDKSLKKNKISASIHLMQSSGGVASINIANKKPVNLLMSGPVAGLIGGIWIGKNAGFSNIITLDVGGTSADIGVAPGGEIIYKHILDTKLGDYNAMVPMAEIDAIGAGGGSIAYLDDGGQFQVGPRSAGALPGPACYGNGGEDATATDCLLAIGWIDSGKFLGGKTNLDLRLAEEAISKNLSIPMAMTIKEAAFSAIRILIHNMVQAIELNSVRRGYDPRDFVLIAFGGAGPMFACEIADEMDIPNVLIPPAPGLTSAIGLLATDVSYEESKTVMLSTSAVDIKKIVLEYRNLETIVRKQLMSEGFSKSQVVLKMYADCRYRGQGYELRMKVPKELIQEKNGQVFSKNFNEIHKKNYGKSFPEKAIEIVNIRIVGIGKMPHIEPQTILKWPNAEPSTVKISSKMTTFFVNGSTKEYVTPRYSRLQLKAGQVIKGPAIIDQMDATTVITPNYSGVIDKFGDIIISKKEGYSVSKSN